jgi:O-antigen biosynthesis protein
MKLRSILRRLGTSAHLLHREPQVLLRLPGFVGRMLQEGPKQTLMRLRQLSDPLRFLQNYPLWLESEHNPTEAETHSMRAWAEALAQPPLISVLMPVYNPQPEWLEAAIASVQQQLYPHWQLCIADDCSTDSAVREVLKRTQDSDSRVEVVFRQENGHISRSSNSALELVRGEWVALLDHDDLLAPEALVWVVRTLLEQPHAQLIYSDEDKIDENGVYHEPYFKPDWNPALIEGQNLFSHLGVYRSDLIRKVGGFREGLEGSQDYDLLLRCLDEVHDEAVVHIPRVLYHWRVHLQSTASGNGAKPYVVAAAVQALSESLQRRREVGSVDALTQGYRIRRQCPKPLPSVEVVIDARQMGLRALCRNLKALVSSTAVPLVFQVITDAHQEAQLHHVSSVAALTLNPVRRLAEVSSAATLLLFWDRHLLARVRGVDRSSDWLIELISQLQAKNVVAAGPKLLHPNGKISHAGLLLSVTQLAIPAHHGFGREEAGYFGRANLVQNLSALPLQGLLVQRTALEEAHGLQVDPLLAPHWSLDLCLRLQQAGGRLVYSPFAELIWTGRFESLSEPSPFSAETISASAQLLRERWGELLDLDPAFNPNLCNDPIDFSLAWPSRQERWPSST